jgi:hypothetical protein
MRWTADTQPTAELHCFAVCACTTMFEIDLTWPRRLARTPFSLC